MCGIFGIVVRRGAVDQALLDAGTDRVAHRGPDGRGTVILGNVGLGHRRLSILDPSSAGHQPMRHAEHPLTIVYNGEIYNYLEIRSELAASGHRFQTGTDTEVILAAYLAWGRACIERFNGMWAFALLDERSGELFCSRDRFGIKPFFWAQTDDALYFGSEMRQLLPVLPHRMGHRAAVADFLASGLSDHRDDGWVLGIQSLAPGCSLRYMLATQHLRVERYYEPRPTAERPTSAADAAERVHAVLTDAVRLRLRSDVRVGTCLSGGLDSSSIAMLASALQPAGAEQFRAITAISEQPDNSEEAYARQVVDRAALAWTAVRPTTKDFEEALEGVISTQETPFGGPSVAMQHFVMNAAREQGVSVLLDGQGADECWFGYERHVAVWLRERASRGVGTYAIALRDALAQQGNLSPLKLLAVAAGGRLPGLVARTMASRYPGLRRGTQLPQAWSSYLASLHDEATIESSDLMHTSLPMLLRHADRSSMHHGVEVRLPFLDWRLVELSMATPVAWKFTHGWSKWPVREAMASVLPAGVAWRRRKLGFEAPDRVWMQNTRPRMRQVVARSPMLAELFNLPHLLASFDRLQRHLAWRLFSLAAWERHQGIEGLK